MGGSTSNRASNQQSNQSNAVQYGTNVWAPQAGYLQNLYGAGQGLFDQSGGQSGAGVGQAAYGANAANLGGMAASAAAGYDPRNINQSLATAGRLQNPGVDPYADVYARQLGSNFREQVLPAIRGGAIEAGGLGSSRANIAEGLAGARVGQQMQDFNAQLYGQNQDRALQAANLGSNIWNQGNAAGNQAAGATIANANFGMGVPWYGAQQFSGLLGKPAMQDLGGSVNAYGSGQGGSSGKGFNIL